MTQQTRSELQRLLSAPCDGELTEAHDGRLETLLRQDAACRRLYLEYIHLHVDLDYFHNQTRLAGHRGPFARRSWRFTVRPGCLLRVKPSADRPGVHRPDGR
jgi:hypothetical protein